MSAAEAFRRQFEAFVAKRPFETPQGQVLGGTAGVFLGSPRGGHKVPPMWRYRHSAAPIEMLFQFYSNFSKHDVICKVTESGIYPHAGQGASVQFNGHLSFALDGNSIAMRHHGLFTIRKRIARPRFVELMYAAAPQTAAILGIGAEKKVMAIRIRNTA